MMSCMGKLHTLRRAIERNPELWSQWFARGAYGVNGHWKPSWSNHYKGFVTHVKRTTARIGLDESSTDAGGERESG